MAITNTTHFVNDILIDGENLRSILATIKARQDSIATALDNAPGDYLTELLDARADNFGNLHATLGSNIRTNQQFLYNLIIEKFTVLQNQYDELSAAVLNLASIIDTHESEVTE